MSKTADTKFNKEILNEEARFWKQTYSKSNRDRKISRKLQQRLVNQIVHQEKKRKRNN